MRRRAFGLAVLAALVIGAWRFWPRVCLLSPHERLLLPLSHHVANIDAAVDIIMGWRSDHEVLLQRRLYSKQGNNQPIDTTWLLDLTNGVYTPLAAVDRRLAPYQVPSEEALSPYGKWQLYYNPYHDLEVFPPQEPVPEEGSLARRKAVAISLEDERTIHFLQNTEGSDMAWLPDERHIAELTNRGNHPFVILHDLMRPEKSVTVPVVIQQRGNPPISLDNTTLGVTASGQVIRSNCMERATYMPEKFRPSIHIQTIDLHSKPAVLREFPVALPQNAEIKQVLISPDGSKIAWKLFLRNIPSRPGWLERWLDYFEKPRRIVLTDEDYRSGSSALWLSRWDGTDLHEIGHINKAQKWVEPTMIGWLPNSKRLSFVYKDALYTVPAD